MQFWSNLQKEYDELFGDGEEAAKENQDEGEMETDFNNMFTDIKKDLKKVPKDDLLPGLSAVPEASDSDDEDGDEDEDDARKSMKIRDAKKKKGRKCKVGDKTYEVGERWKDPTTGKDMICILMNVPKSVQNKLIEADVTITREEAQPKSEEPSVKPKTTGPQWAYTNKQPKSRGCPSDKESEKPDQVGSEDEKDTNDNQEEQGDDFGGSPLDGNILAKETETMERDESIEDQSGEDAGNSTQLSEKDSVTRDQIGKESDDNSEEMGVGDKVKSKMIENSNKEVVDEESESESDSEEERRRVQKENQDLDDSEYEERDEDKIKHTDMKRPEINVTAEDKETAVVQAGDLEERSGSTEKKSEEESPENLKRPDITDSQKSETPASEGVPETREKGQTIYTKETTVTQRKLLKTSETIESVETERNVD